VLRVTLTLLCEIPWVLWFLQKVTKVTKGATSAMPHSDRDRDLGGGTVADGGQEEADGALVDAFDPHGEDGRWRGFGQLAGPFQQAGEEPAVEDEASAVLVGEDGGGLEGVGAADVAVLGGDAVGTEAVFRAVFPEEGGSESGGGVVLLIGICFWAAVAASGVRVDR